jgi:IS1 family transposase
VYVLPKEKQLGVIHLLVEGSSIRSAERLTGVHRDTIMRLIVRIGQKCAAMHDRWMRNLTLRHIQCDEIWTFVLKKQGRIPVALDVDPRIGDQYLFVGIDQDTKLIPSYVLGKRTKVTTDRFMGDLESRLVLPQLFGPGQRPQISTDGWRAYPESVDAAFAGRADHGVLVKNYRNTDMPGRYGPPEMIGTDRQVINGGIDEWSICTSHVERSNLTIRTLLKRFTRLALGFSKKFENLEAAISLYMGYYNFCWMHRSLAGTPAMAAKITGHPWTVAELVSEAESE